MEKKCTKCGVIKPLEEFHVAKCHKSGRRSNCKECYIKYYKKWREDPIIKEKLNSKAKKYRDSRTEEEITIDNKYFKDYYENHKQDAKKRRENNIEKIKIREKKYKQLNKEETKRKIKLRKQTDDLFKMKFRIRKMIYKVLKRNGYMKNAKTASILGCSFIEFKQHIESKWELWMNWSNYGKYNGKTKHGWDIDHIIPLSSAKTEKELLKLFHYTNCQPLCSYINRHVKKDNIL